MIPSKWSIWVIEIQMEEVITPIGIKGYFGIIYNVHVNMGVETFLTRLVTVNNLDAIFMIDESLGAT